MNFKPQIFETSEPTSTLTTTSEVQELLTSFTTELKRSDIKLEGVIGQGKCLT